MHIKECKSNAVIDFGLNQKPNPTLLRLSLSIPCLANFAKIIIYTIICMYIRSMYTYYMLCNDLLATPIGLIYIFGQKSLERFRL